MERCIVIADDDPIIVDLVKMRLGMARFRVLSTRDPATAMEMVRTEQPVAVILDVQMPGSGPDALAKIKADPETAQLPVLMLTGERRRETATAAIKDSANGYLVKPFHPDALLERVSRLVHLCTMNWDKALPGPVWEI
jgi:DNA-binding response OmpR family regulator